jgi:hypothetical protein
MVAIVPVVLLVPTMFILAPPAMMLTPAALARFVEFVTLVLGPPAVASVALDGLMQLMVGVCDPSLAILY